MFKNEPSQKTTCSALALASAIALAGCFDSGSDDEESADTDNPDENLNEERSTDDSGEASPSDPSPEGLAVTDQSGSCDAEGVTILGHDDQGELIYMGKTSDEGIADLSEIPEDGYFGVKSEDINNNPATTHIPLSSITDSHRVRLRALSEDQRSNCEPNDGPGRVETEIQNEDDFEEVTVINLADQPGVLALGEEEQGFQGPFKQYAYEEDLPEDDEVLELTIDQDPREIVVDIQLDPGDITFLSSDMLLVGPEDRESRVLQGLESLNAFEHDLSTIRTINEPGELYISTQYSTPNTIRATQGQWIDNTQADVTVGEINPVTLSDIYMTDDSVEFSAPYISSELENHKIQMDVAIRVDGVSQYIIYPDEAINNASVPLLELPEEITTRDTSGFHSGQVRVTAYENLEHQKYWIDAGYPADIQMSEGAYIERHNNDNAFIRAIFPDNSISSVQELRSD